MSAAAVSGIAADVWRRNSGLDAAQVMTAVFKGGVELEKKNKASRTETCNDNTGARSVSWLAGRARHAVRRSAEDAGWTCGGHVHHAGSPEAGRSQDRGFVPAAADRGGIAESARTRWVMWHHELRRSAGSEPRAGARRRGSLGRRHLRHVQTLRERWKRHVDRQPGLQRRPALLRSIRPSSCTTRTGPLTTTNRFNGRTTRTGGSGRECRRAPPKTSSRGKSIGGTTVEGLCGGPTERPLQISP